VILFVFGEEGVEFDAEVSGLDVLEESRWYRGNFLHCEYYFLVKRSCALASWSRILGSGSYMLI